MKMSETELELRLSDALQRIDVLNDKLSRAYSLIGDIDGSLPSGLESWLTQEELNNWYENGEL
jgi:hypothetical protein